MGLGQKRAQCYIYFEEADALAKLWREVYLLDPVNFDEECRAFVKDRLQYWDSIKDKITKS